MEAMVGEEEMAEKYECSGVSHSCPYIPECLVFNILLRLPVKSVGRFRCVSTLWLSISTDPFFIAAHNRRTPKYLICPLIRMLHKNELFNASITGFDRRGGANVPLSSCDGLVCFISDFSSKVPCTNYVLNTLTGLRIDFPSPSANMYGKYSSMRELYYHRWTGQYRILSVNGKHAEVLSLGGAMDSWRRINSELPSTQVLLPSWRRCFLVNDCLYWICSAVEGIIVFDVLEEAFSCMDLPHDVGGPNYGLIDIDGKLGCWMASQNAIDSSYQINIWVKVEGGDKWGSSSAYSLHLGVVESRRLIHPYTPDATIPFVFFSKGDIFLLLNGLDMLYLLRWDLYSGIYSTQELSYEHITGFDRVLIHKETLMDIATITQHV